MEKELIQKLFEVPDEEQTSVEEKGHKQVDESLVERKGSKEISTDGNNVPSQKEVEAYLVQRRKQQVKQNKFIILYACIHIVLF